jgi:hypothetical protein
VPRKQLLIVITGPVGGGKSTTSIAVAQEFRRPDLQVAVIDLDQVYGFVRQQVGHGEQVGWRRARLAAGAMSQALFDDGISFVILDGEFFNQTELDEAVGGVAPEVRRCFFSLRVSYEKALARAQPDPTRGASKDPLFLEPWWNGTYLPALPFLEATTVVIDTEQLTAEEVVVRLVTALADAARL